MRKLMLLLALASATAVAAPTKETIRLEAENGIQTLPMTTKFDYKAGSDLYVESTTTTNGKLNLYFTTNLVSSTYSVWGRVIANAPDGISLTIETNSMSAQINAETNWKWVRLGLFNLSKGLHNLEIKSKAGIKIDQVVISNDVNTSSTSLAGVAVFHNCPQPPPDVSDKCIENIVQHQIKPIYESNISSYTKCVQINEIINTQIEPLLARSDANFKANFFIECATCTLSEVTHGCPWEIEKSTPTP